MRPIILRTQLAELLKNDNTTFEAVVQESLRQAQVWRFISYESKNLLGKDVSR
jgi:hypothetical protein